MAAMVSSSLVVRRIGCGASAGPDGVAEAEALRQQLPLLLRPGPRGMQHEPRLERGPAAADSRPEGGDATISSEVENL